MTLHETPLGRRVIGCAIEVHRVLGPGLLEGAYEECLAQEMRSEGIPFERQIVLPVDYKGTLIHCGFRADFVVSNELIVEIKSIAQLAPIHTAQVLTYLKLSGLHQGFLINFNHRRLKDGLKSLLL